MCFRPLHQLDCRRHDHNRLPVCPSKQQHELSRLRGVQRSEMQHWGCNRRQDFDLHSRCWSHRWIQDGPDHLPRWAKSVVSPIFNQVPSALILWISVQSSSTSRRRQALLLLMTARDNGPKSTRLPPSSPARGSTGTMSRTPSTSSFPARLLLANIFSASSTLLST